jgi:hypothetical protein
MSYEGSAARRASVGIRNHPLARTKSETSGQEKTATAWPRHPDGSPAFERMNSAQRLAYDSARLK